jgi:GNAT superfamily N-acetyltransferase
MTKYKFKEISSELWPDFEKLFGKNGACGGCWCQWWRLPKGGMLWQETKGARAKRTTKYLVKNDLMTGLLAYDGDLPVAWCSYGPRTDFPRTERMKAYRRDDIAEVWSLNCFFIDKKYRGTGLARESLKAALKFMQKRRVEIVEAYPVPLTKDGKKLPAAFTYTGPLKIFEEAGFEIVQRISYSRPLVRKKLM